MCYLYLLAETLTQKFLPPPPRDSLQHLQSHPSLCAWQLVLGRASLQKDRVALWGVMQPREALPYSAPQGFPCSGHCQGTERGKFYYCSEHTLEETATFCLLYDSVA